MKTLSELIRDKYPEEPTKGDTYQNGVLPGPTKLAQFRECLALAETPALYSQENVDALVRVKIFDPCGSWTWYITEWDGEDQCFGLVKGFESELGYMSLEELSQVEGGRGIGLELDMHWTPRPLSQIPR